MPSANNTVTESIYLDMLQLFVFPQIGVIERGGGEEEEEEEEEEEDDDDDE
jgi:hypothetical protein